MTSPLLALCSVIAASPFRVAPEAAEDIDSLVRAKGLSLELTDDPKVFAEVLPSRALIRLGMNGLDLLWAAAHSYVVLFDEYEKANQRGDEFFGVGENPRARSAFALYEWALNQFLTRTTSPWPEFGIFPEPHPEPGTDCYVTNELFLVAISWIIHHEIAHARLDHDEFSVRPLAEENAADKQATLWICATAAESSELLKRALGIAAAILVLVACDLQTAHFSSITHPPSFERLMFSLDHTGLAEDSKVYAFAYVQIQIHLAKAGVQFHQSEGSFREMCREGCLEIRRVSHFSV